jgi:hypothetical protein
MKQEKDIQTKKTNKKNIKEEKNKTRKKKLKKNGKDKLVLRRKLECEKRGGVQPTNTKNIDITTWKKNIEHNKNMMEHVFEKISI